MKVFGECIHQSGKEVYFLICFFCAKVKGKSQLMFFCFEEKKLYNFENHL